MNKVRFIRYLREVSDRGRINNMGGVTMLFRLNYKKRTVRVRFSVCARDENFDRETGIEYALNDLEHVYDFDLDWYQNMANKYGGFAYVFVAELNNWCVESKTNPLISLSGKERALLNYYRDTQ